MNKPLGDRTFDDAVLATLWGLVLPPRHEQGSESNLQRAQMVCLVYSKAKLLLRDWKAQGRKAARAIARAERRQLPRRKRKAEAPAAVH